MSTPHTPQNPPAARKRPPPRRVEVARIAALSPHMARITFRGPELHTFAWSGPASHLKLIVPEEGAHDTPMPTPEGLRPTNMRTYTPRHFDAETGELDIDFVLHDHGPAGRWAMRAQVGDSLVLIGPGPAYQIDPEAKHFVLAGECTSLPAIETILAILPPAATADVLIEVEDARDARPLQSAATVAARWLPSAADSGAALEAALLALVAPLSRESTRIYVGCESAAMRRMRRVLLKELAFEKRSIVTRGYWKQGVANNPDGDYGDDVE